jgi:hypothetical protein
MGFGFDPSIILASRPAAPSGPSLVDLLQSRQTMQANQIKLADMLRQQQQQMRLSDIYRQNAGNPSAVGQALMAGGFGREALDFTANQSDADARAVAARKALQEAVETERRRGELADPNSPTSKLRRDVANQFGAHLDPTVPGRAVDDKEMDLLERAQTARQLAQLRYGSGAIAGYSPEAIDTMASQILNTGHMPQFGPGATGAALRQAVVNRVSELAAGATPGERGGGSTPRAVPDLASAAADNKANAQSLEHATVQADAVNGFTRTFDKNIGILENALAGLNSSDSPFANKGLRWLQKNATGNPNYTAFVNALNTVRSELGKINSGSTGAGGVPISLLQEMEHGLPEDATPAQITAALKVYRQDSENRRAAMEEQRQEIRGRLGTKKPTTPAPKGLGRPPASEDELQHMTNEELRAYLSNGGAT